MTINAYIYKLVKQMRECEDITERNALRVKLDYARAYKNGTLANFRDRAIEREIGKTYSEGAQIAILFNRDNHPDEYEAYQTFRTECKATVDENIARLNAELLASIEEG